MAFKSQLENLLEEATSKKNNAKESAEYLKIEIDSLEKGLKLDLQDRAELAFEETAQVNYLNSIRAELKEMDAKYDAELKELQDKAPPVVKKFMIFDKQVNKNELTRALKEGFATEETLRRLAIAAYFKESLYTYSTCVRLSNNAKQPKISSFNDKEKKIVEYLERYGLTEDEAKEIAGIREILNEGIDEIHNFVGVKITVDELEKRIDSGIVRLEHLNQHYEMDKADIKRWTAQEELYLTKIREDFVKLNSELQNLDGYIQQHPKYQQIATAFDVVSNVVKKVFSNGNHKSTNRLAEMTGLNSFELSPENPSHLHIARTQLLKAITDPEGPAGAYKPELFLKIIGYSKKPYNPQDVAIGLGCLTEDHCSMLQRREAIAQQVDTLSTYVDNN